MGPEWLSGPKEDWEIICEFLNREKNVQPDGAVVTSCTSCHELSRDPREAGDDLQVTSCKDDKLSQVVTSCHEFSQSRMSELVAVTQDG